MKKLNIVFSLLLVASLGAHAQNVREALRLDEGWHFALGHASDPKKNFGSGTEYFNYLTKANSVHNLGPYVMKFDDSAWEDVRVPHDWVNTLPFAPGASHSHGYKTIGWKYPETSVGWYRKIISVPTSDLGKTLRLRFDGIFRNATVWFNGIYMGTEPSGYATQVYDVTEYANYGGDNLICVCADASLEEGWFYEGAGIYRDVWFEKSAAVSVAPMGTFIYADLKAPYTSSIIYAETEVHNASTETSASCQVRQTLKDAQGKAVATSDASSLTLSPKETKGCKLRMSLSNPHLWSTTDPYLYTVETEVLTEGQVVDVYTTRIGLREVEFDAQRGFLLNGKPLKLKGVNLHQDHSGVGAAMPEALLRYRIKRLKEIGCNAYRSSHNPMTPAMLDVCDEEGILVIDENRLMGVNSEHLRLLETMIRRDRNHPSVILWSDGNEEWGLENNVMGVRVAAAMREYTRQFDPTRHSTVANAGGVELIKSLDVVGFNYIAQNDVMNRHLQHPDWKIVGTEESTGCGTRGVYWKDERQPGHMPSINRGTEPGVENVIERGWQFYAENDWASGLFYWTGFDYRGEPNPLAYPAVDSEFGIFDYCGFWKDEAWYLKSVWTNEPTLHIFPHWNLQGHEGEEVELWAYSNCEEVELTVNGRSLGRQRMPKNGHLKWKAVYQQGTVKAVGYKGGKRILTETIATTGASSLIEAKADRSVISADGRDLSVITVELKDKKGRFVPDACPMVKLHLEGDGRILGVGNGDPSFRGEDHPKQLDCKDFEVPAFNGLAQVLVQSGKQGGVLRLTCTAEAHKGSEVQIETK